MVAASAEVVVVVGDVAGRLYEILVLRPGARPLTTSSRQLHLSSPSPCVAGSHATGVRGASNKQTAARRGQ
jgi:hypothetical protein